LFLSPEEFIAQRHNTIALILMSLEIMFNSFKPKGFFIFLSCHGSVFVS